MNETGGVFFILDTRKHAHGTSRIDERMNGDVLTEEKLADLTRRYWAASTLLDAAAIHFQLAKFALNTAYPPALAVELMRQLLYTFRDQLLSTYYLRALLLRESVVPSTYSPAIILRLCFAQPLLQPMIVESMNVLLTRIQRLNGLGVQHAQSLMYKVIRPYIFSVLSQSRDARDIDFLFDAYRKHFSGKAPVYDTRPLTEKLEELYRAFGRFLFARDVVRFYKAAYLLEQDLSHLGASEDKDVFWERVEVAQEICKRILQNANPPRADANRLVVTATGPMRLLWALYQRSALNSPARVVYEQTLAARYENTAELFDSSAGFTVSLADKLFAWRVLHICNGLQWQRLPTLVLLTIVDEGIPNNYTMHKKWQLITTVRHFLDRKAVASGDALYGFY